MLNFSKKVEYGLIALRFMASNEPGMPVTAKEIAQRYEISYELLSKVLQKLTRAGIVASFKGVNGGYILSRSPQEIKISTVIQAIENKSNIALINCEAENPGSCNIFNKCTIKTPLFRIQNLINNIFNEMSISEIV